MALSPFNDNIQINANKPLDNKYYKNGLTIYASVSEANSIIPQAYRYRGLTVAIDVSGTITEYWYFAGVADENLVVKDLGQVPAARTITTLPTISGGGDLSANRTFAVVDNTNIQKIQVRYNSTGDPVGTRKTINLIPGTNVTISVVDDNANDQVNVTINASGGGGGGGYVVERYDYIVTGSPTTTVSVLDSIGASGVFPAFVFPTVLYTSTSNSSPSPEQVYANLTTGLWTFGTQLEVGQVVSFYWWRPA